MDDPYRRFLTSMSRAGLPQASSLQTVQQQVFHGMPSPVEASPSEANPQSAGYFHDPQFDSSKAPSRKKPGPSNPAVDAVKHRRTRSGCFTCRSRRVKCDEKRPICERCQKGSRECVYPDPPSRKVSTSRASRSATSQQGKVSPLSSSGDYDEQAVVEKTKSQHAFAHETFEDDLENSASQRSSGPHTVTPPSGSGAAGRDGSETPSQEDGRSSPSTSTGPSSAFKTVPFDPADFPQPSESLPEWSHLPRDYQEHLNWYDENMTYYHYGLNNDTDNFFKVLLPSMAMRNDALLNALVGFSAYQSTIQHPDGKIEDFLGYYNKSVTLLLNSMKRMEKHSVVTLITILQLAQIEEYLGDWVNILGHQKAALEIFTNIFTPQLAAETPVGRMCLSWYARFDGFVAIMGSLPIAISRDYFDRVHEFCKSHISKFPTDLTWMMSERSARLRQLSWRQALLCARKSSGHISPEEFSDNHKRLTEDLNNYKSSWNPATTNPQYLVTDFGGRQPGPDNISNPYEPGILYDFPLFPTTVAAAEWHSLMIMHLIQAQHVPLEELFPELSKHAHILCRYYETLQYWPHTPPGVMVQLQAMVQTTILFLPRDEKHDMWIRRQSACAETLGYIRPLSHREKVAQFLGNPSCVRWWLPDDEGFTPILQSIREFADERNAVAVTAQQESVREVRQFFEQFGNLSLE